jgi:uncharacterized protein with HEPN domain
MSPEQRTPTHVADMLQFIVELQALAGHVSREDYLADRILNLAFEKLFINLGDAANRIDPAQRAGIVGVPWRQIIGLRNILAHGYEQIEHESVYRTASSDLAAVEAALRAWLDGQG